MHPFVEDLQSGCICNQVDVAIVGDLPIEAALAIGIRDEQGMDAKKGMRLREAHPLPFESMRSLFAGCRYLTSRLSF